MNRLLPRIAIASVCVFLFSSSSAHATKNQYNESFTTTTYKDAVNTTADWNTTAGVLKLFPSVSLAGACDTPGAAWNVAVCGDYAFVADYEAGLRIINISDLSAPSVVGAYDTPGDARDVAVDGDYAFVADYGSGLQIINITNPASPTLIGTYNTPGYAMAIAVDGDYAFVADYGSGSKSSISTIRPVRH